MGVPIPLPPALLSRRPALLAALLAAWLPSAAVAQLDHFPQVDPLPVEAQKEGVLFRVLSTNPEVRTIFVVGSHNGWGGQFAAGQPINPNDRMYGPSEEGLFELYYPVAPGTHTFMFSINGDYNQRIYGHSSHPRAQDFFGEQAGEKLHNMVGSVLQFGLDEPPWPPIFDTAQMLPTIVMRDGQPHMRARYFSTSAETLHMLGSWNDWKGSGEVTVSDDSLRMKETPIAGLYEAVVGPISVGEFHYKFVVDRRNWLADPVVVETNSHGNSIINVQLIDGQYRAVYTPRFDPAKPRGEWDWDAGQIPWVRRTDEGFRQASLRNAQVFWVVVLPGSKPSEQFLAQLEADDFLRGRLQRLVPLNTPAHEVRDMVRDRMIARLPHVMVLDKDRKVLWEAAHPELDDVRETFSKHAW